MIRSREEWEATELGKAVKAMPLIRQAKEPPQRARFKGSTKCRPLETPKMRTSGKVLIFEYIKRERE